tara:strand:+ start:2622 stop:2780 length:159 start_codon:yes stop_codon:yes gene_type:complete
MNNYLKYYKEDGFILLIMFPFAIEIFYLDEISIQFDVLSIGFHIGIKRSGLW